MASAARPPPARPGRGQAGEASASVSFSQSSGRLGSRPAAAATCAGSPAGRASLSLAYIGRPLSPSPNNASVSCSRSGRRLGFLPAAAPSGAGSLSGRAERRSRLLDCHPPPCRWRSKRRGAVEALRIAAGQGEAAAEASQGGDAARPVRRAAARRGRAAGRAAAGRGRVEAGGRGGKCDQERQAPQVSRRHLLEGRRGHRQERACCPRRWLASSSPWPPCTHEGWMVRYGRRKIGRFFFHMCYFVLERRLLAYYKPKDNMGVQDSQSVRIQ